MSESYVQWANNFYDKHFGGVPTVLDERTSLAKELYEEYTKGGDGHFWNGLSELSRNGWLMVADLVLKREDALWQHAEGNEP